MEADEVLGGRYRLVAPIASGGMGTVWRARHVELDSDVAVKVMSDALLRAPTALARFQREARAAAQLKSPHVVQVFDYGVHDGQPYLAMELLHGEDLKGYLDRLGALPLGRAAQILDALAKALRLAHAAGIVHRDLKPANVFLHQSGGDEIVKILDFGIAKDLSPQPDGLRTSTSTVVGSPLYMSPEQVRGADVDHRTDLWSLAVVVFEMVTGRQPFEGASLGDVFARIVADEIPAASSLVPGLPPAIDAFFARALSRVPSDRPESAVELGESFRAAIEGDAAREVTTRVVPVFVPKIARDAPTLGDVPAAPLAPAAARTSSSSPPPRVDLPTSAQARTALREKVDSHDLELARTIATGAPSVRPTPAPSTNPRATSFTRVAMAGGVLLLGAGALFFAPWRDPAPAPTPFPAGSEAPQSLRDVAPTSVGDTAPPYPPGPLVEPASPSADGASSTAASASAAPSASAATPASAAPTVSAARPTGAAPSARPPAAPRTAPPPGASVPSPPRPSATTDPVFGVPVRAP